MKSEFDCCAHSWPRLMNREVIRIHGIVRREDFLPIEEDAKGAWMSNEGKVAAFLPLVH